jgi:hypothetical protein
MPCLRQFNYHIRSILKNRSQITMIKFVKASLNINNHLIVYLINLRINMDNVKFIHFHLLALVLILSQIDFHSLILY